MDEWQHENKDRDNFRLKGFEEIQKTFSTFKNASESVKESIAASANLCETLVLLRLFELFEAARNLAIEKEKKWIRVPLIVKADRNELIYLLK